MQYLFTIIWNYHLMLWKAYVIMFPISGCIVNASLLTLIISLSYNSQLFTSKIDYFARIFCIYTCTLLIILYYWTFSPLVNQLYQSNCTVAGWSFSNWQRSFKQITLNLTCSLLNVFTNVCISLKVVFIDYMFKHWIFLHFAWGNW